VSTPMSRSVGVETIPPPHLQYISPPPDELQLNQANQDAFGDDNQRVSSVTIAICTINAKWQAAISYAVTMPQLSRTYVAQIREMARDFRLELPDSITCMICPKCSSVLIAGINSSLRAGKAKVMPPVRIDIRRTKATKKLDAKKDLKDQELKQAPVHPSTQTSGTQSGSVAPQKPAASTGGPSKLTFVSPFSMSSILPPKSVGPQPQSQQQQPKPGRQAGKTPQLLGTKQSPQGSLQQVTQSKQSSAPDAKPVASQGDNTKFRRVVEQDRDIAWSCFRVYCYACGFTTELAEGNPRGNVCLDTKYWRIASVVARSSQQPSFIQPTSLKDMVMYSNPAPLIRPGKRTRRESTLPANDPEEQPETLVDVLASKIERGAIAKVRLDAEVPQLEPVVEKPQEIKPAQHKAVPNEAMPKKKDKPTLQRSPALSRPTRDQSAESHDPWSQPQVYDPSSRTLGVGSLTYPPQQQVHQANRPQSYNSNATPAKQAKKPQRLSAAEAQRQKLLSMARSSGSNLFL